MRQNIRDISKSYKAIFQKSTQALLNAASGKIEPFHPIGAGDPCQEAWGGMRPLLSRADNILVYMIYSLYG